MGAGPSNMGVAAYPDTKIAAAKGGDQAIVVASATYDWATPLTLDGASAADARRRITLAVLTNGGTAATHTSLTLYPTATDRTNGTNGVSLTQRFSAGQSPDTASTNYLSEWDADLPTGGTWYLRLVASAAGARATMFAWTHSRAFATAGIELGSAAATSLSGNADVVAGGLAIAVASVTSASAVVFTPTGFTEQFDGAVSGTVYQEAGMFDNTGGGLQAAKAFGSACFLASDGVTPAGSNYRLAVATYGAAA